MKLKDVPVHSLFTFPEGVIVYRLVPGRARLGMRPVVDQQFFTTVYESEDREVRVIHTVEED